MFRFALLLLLGGAPSADDVDPEALRAYEAARARFESRSPEGLGESLELFELAAALEPGFAEAHAGAADAAALLALYGYAAPDTVLPRAETSAGRAIELAPELASAHASLGLVRYLYRWRYDEAEASFRKAIALEPSYAAVRHWYAMMLMVVGRHEASLVEIEAAVSLEPDSPLYLTKRAALLMAAGRLDEAESRLVEVAERFPGFTMAHRELAELALERGRVEEALRHLERGAPDEPLYGYVLGRLGRREDAARVLRRVSSTEGYASPIDAALVHAGLGEDDRALDELERALAAKDPALVYIGEQPGFAALRDEPRFEAILERLGL